MEYRTVYQGGKGEIVEKKSRFIAEVFLVHSEEEAMQYLEQVRKKYWDARHHCWAYVIGEERVTERCSDDGEPSGTAGKPILEIIRGAGFWRDTSLNGRSGQSLYRISKRRDFPQSDYYQNLWI